MELPLLAGESNYFNVASFQEKGLLLYRTILAPDANYIELQKLDTGLNAQWKGFIPLDRNLSFFKAKTKGSFLILLFSTRNQINANFHALVVNESKGSYAVYTVNNAIPFNPTEFEVTGTAIIIGGYLNFRPIVIHYNLLSRNTKVLPGYFTDPGELTQVRANPDGSFDIIVRAKNIEKKRCLWLRNYDADGTLLKATMVVPEKNKSLIYGKSLLLPSGDQILAGVYGRYVDYSRGVFFARIRPSGEYKINYHSYGELPHFFGFMKPQREKRIKQRIEKKKAKGRTIKLNYRFLVHDIISASNNFVLVAESYFPHFSYPTYQSRYSYVPTFGGNPYLNANQSYRGDYVFDGYQYTHAMVVGFDSRATLLWDNSLEINDIRNMQLEQFVKVIPHSESTGLYYLFENTVRSKIINDSIVLAAKKAEEIKSDRREEENVKKFGEANGLQSWYGNYLVASGVQRLKLTGQGRYAPERRVFYINKLQVDQ